MANISHSSGVAGTSEAMRLAVDTAAEHTAARIVKLLNPGDGMADKETLGESIACLTQNVLEAALPIAVGEAIQEAIDAMSPDSAKALAKLGQDAPASQPKSNDTARTLRQELGDDIELGTRTALVQAIGKIGDSVLQIASAADSRNSVTGMLTAAAHQQLLQVLRINFGAALRSVNDNVTLAVTAIAAKALAARPHAGGTKPTATQSSLQIPFEVGIRA
jgi:hypothetical protein